MMVLLLAFSVSVSAQKKELIAARQNIKKGVNLVATEQSLRKLLKDSANVKNEKIWSALFDVVKKQYEQDNEKLYLKQGTDTARMFQTTRHMFETLEALDSIDSSYRKSHAAYLVQYRTNLYNGGLFHIGKQQYSEAFLFLQTYISTDTHPLFSGYPFQTEDVELPQVAYWTVYCGYKLNDADMMLKYKDLALEDTVHRVYVLQYLTEAYRVKKDTTNYRLTLEQGFRDYPTHNYFFPRLMFYYEGRQEYQKVLDSAERLLAIDSLSVAGLMAKSTSLLNLDQYEDCITASDSLIALRPDNAIGYRNAALASYNMTLSLASRRKLLKHEKKELNSLYESALPYFEKYRKLAPEDKKVWLKPLYEIYLNLNMGDEFEEIEALIEGN